MKKVKDIMVKKVVTFEPGDSVYEVAKTLREKRISGAPVVEGKKIVGVISEADIMKLVETHYITINTILPSPLDVLEFPVRMKLQLESALDKIRKTAGVKVGDAMAKKIITISPDATIEEAARIMAEKKVNRLPVVDKIGNLKGIVSRGDVIGAI